MELIKVTPRGYCKGVTRAITLAKNTVKQYPDKEIYVLGMLVHNRYVMEALAQLHIKTVDDKVKIRIDLLDEIPKGSVVIFTAHGIGPSVVKKAKKLGLITVDASCPDVVKTQDIVSSKLLEGYEIFYIGKQHHPEAEAICSLSTHVHLIRSTEDISTLPLYEQVFVTNQTTMSIFDIKRLFEAIQKQYPHALFSEEICNATRIRQEAVEALRHQQIDVLYVVGDKHSNNSNRLAQIAKEQDIPEVYLIDDVTDIREEQVCNKQRIAVTSGASTPTYLTTQVLSYLENWQDKKAKPVVEIEKIL